jgi:hypothetical protein
MLIKITLSPMRMDATLSLCRDDDVLMINDVRLNLANYKAGGSDWIIGQPAQSDGVWQVRVLFPYGPNARKNLLFPKPILLRKNGPIKIPSTRSIALKPA